MYYFSLLNGKKNTCSNIVSTPHNEVPKIPVIFGFTELNLACLHFEMRVEIVMMFFSLTKIKTEETYNKFILSRWPSLADSMILFRTSSDTVVNGTLSNPSGPSRKTATTGLVKSFCHIRLPVSRSNVTVNPLLLPEKCKNSEKISRNQMGEISNDKSI